MPVAYLIRAHFRPAQLGRLVARLDTPSARFFIHVSARTSEETYEAMRHALAGRSNVVWTPRVDTYYGGFSMLRAALASLELIAEAGPLPDQTVLLSGQCYPLRPAPEIEAYLDERRGKTLMRNFPLPSDEWAGEGGGLDRLERMWFERISYRTRLFRLPLVRRRMPKGLEPYGGSAWVALSAEAVEYVLRTLRERPDVLRFFRHTLIPDELFFQTLLMSSPFRDSVLNESLHYIDWSGGGVHPAVLTIRDFPALRESGRLFARKFDVKVDGEVLDRIDAELLRGEV
jgi:hypothetical protein